MSSLIKTLLLTVAPLPAEAGAAILRPQAVAIKEGGTGLHLHHRPLLPAAGPLVIPGPALALAVTEGLHVVAVKTNPGMAVGGTTAHRPVATGPAVIPTPVHPPRTDTRARDVIGLAPGLTPGHAPGHQAIRVGVGAGGW